jgi:hypothetical protein
VQNYKCRQYLVATILFLNSINIIIIIIIINANYYALEFYFIVTVILLLLPDFLSSSGSGTGSTQPREVNWGAIWIKKVAAPV